MGNTVTQCRKNCDLFSHIFTHVFGDILAGLPTERYGLKGLVNGSKIVVRQFLGFRFLVSGEVMSTIDALVCLSVPQKVTLHRSKWYVTLPIPTSHNYFSAGITTQNALLALTTRELSKKLNVAPAKADALFQDVITELAPKLFLPVKQVARHTTGRITTGDTFLDDMLGGGIRSGTVTELVGERLGTLLLFT